MAGEEVPTNEVPTPQAPEQDGNADTATLLTRPGEGVEQNAPETQEEKPEQEKDPSAVVPDKPDGYALNFAEGTNVDTALLGDFKTAAHELGLTQTQAQKLAALYESHAASSSQKAQETQTAALIEAKRGWESEISSRPGFQKEVGDARRVLVQFGSSELNSIMDQSLIGSHPAFFDFVVKVGKALGEPGFKGIGVVGQEKSAAKTLYPDMA